jgi:hypothetical protein
MEYGIRQKENFVKSATLSLLILAASISSWSATNVPANMIKSSKHYRESGVGNATGRSGSATMTARALLGKDGSTKVEVSTGTLDSSSVAPGNFRKIQYKALTAGGQPSFVENYFPNTTGGYYSFVSSSLHRSQQMQLQANITDIDRNRTDVVTVVETVKERPDLAVQNLTLPSSAMVSRPVNISANLVEMNSDAGATTTCVLAVDGKNVDQVNNVYVDAGGSVSCAFVYLFNIPGSHTITVSATNVAPADWDATNNSGSGSITITNPMTAESAFATFEDDNGGFPVANSSTYQEWSDGVLMENVSQSYGTSGHTQNSDVQFSSQGCAGKTNAVPWQFPVNLTYTEAMDGTPVYTYAEAVTGNSVTFTGFSQPTCGGTAVGEIVQNGSSFTDDHWNYLSSVQYFDSAATVLQFSQNVEVQRFAGDVTYFSFGYQCFWFSASSGNCSDPSNTGDYYAYNTPGTQASGSFVALGSNWIPSVDTLDAAGNTFSGNISVALTSSQQTNVQPNTCTTYGPDSTGFAYQSCSSSNNNYTITEGSATESAPSN